MRIGFALEYSLGHATHAENLKNALKTDACVCPTYIDLPFQNTPGWWSRLPGVRSNWSLRASLGAYVGLRRRARSLDAAFFHTQVTALLSTGLMRRVPSVVSLDATPVQIDALGSSYRHVPSRSQRIEALKRRLNTRAFAAARLLVSWSQWAKQSLVADYGMPADKIVVIPPGIDTERWKFSRTPPTGTGPLNLLFVGGDFARKGGDTLLEAFRQLPENLDTHLHIVTRTVCAAEGLRNVHLYRDLAPNSEALLRLYAEADLFVFPTRGDCLPLAVMEALSAGLPVITTSVGALPEAVTHNEAGLIVPRGDPHALAEAIRTLNTDPRLRASLGHRAREVALERFNAATNYRRLIEVVHTVAEGAVP